MLVFSGGLGDWPSAHSAARPFFVYATANRSVLVAIITKSG